MAIFGRGIGELLCFFGLLIAGPVFAKSNPILTSLENGIEDGKAPSEKTSLVISALRVDVHVVGRTADVVLEARLSNTSDDTDEARFSLSLPANAVVTGYALDVDGRMISGQLLDQPKARNVYADEIRKGIDPGLAEVTESNQFQTRVFPITQERPRTIRVLFSTPFDPALGFVLPLETFKEVADFSINTKIDGYQSPPLVKLGGGALSLSKKGMAWNSSEAIKAKRLTGELSITGGVLANDLTVSRYKNGKSFFQISDADTSKLPATSYIGRLRIYWDRSLSRRDDLLDKEVDLIESYVAAANPSAIDLVSYASDTPAVLTVSDTPSLRRALNMMVYRGGTSISGLDDLKLAAADQCLLFSDGTLTLDHEARFRPDCKLTIIASAADANGVSLGRLAQSSKGQLIRLTATNRTEVLPLLLKPAVAVVAARDDTGGRLDFRILPSTQGGWFAVGEMPDSGDVHLTISGLKKGLTQRIYSAGDKGIFDTDAPAALWASMLVAELSDDLQAHDKMVSMARAYQVASPSMAFLVLESPSQYLNADIKPPEGFSKKWMEEYREAKNERIRISQNENQNAWNMFLNNGNCAKRGGALNL